MGARLGSLKRTTVARRPDWREIATKNSIDDPRRLANYVEHAWDLILRVEDRLPTEELLHAVPRRDKASAQPSIAAIRVALPPAAVVSMQVTRSVAKRAT